MNIDNPVDRPIPPMSEDISTRKGRPPRRGWSPPPITPVTDTPEFKRALAAAVAGVTAQIREELVASLKETGSTPAADDQTRQLFSQMALAIAEISDQGTNRKRVAPEILAQRAAAHERMIKLIIEAKENGEKPEYKLIAKTYLNERLIEPYRVDNLSKQARAVECYWSGIPNEAMRPLNEVARRIYAEYKLSIGSVEQGKRADNRPVWVTAGGLVIKGDAPGQRRQVASLEEPVTNPTAPKPAIEYADNFVEKNPFDPTAEFINVLGTIHPPARQNASTERPH
jgi:hypothetical protein